LFVCTPHTTQVRLAIFDNCNSNNLSVIPSNSAACYTWQRHELSTEVNQSKFAQILRLYSLHKVTNKRFY